MNKTRTYKELREPERKDYFDILKDLPPLPDGTEPLPPFSRENPVIIDVKTGDLYYLNNRAWRLADK